jgi:hypothetical protein
MSTEYKVYLLLEQASIKIDVVDSVLSEQIRCILDELWDRLSDEEKAELGNRQGVLYE